MDKLQEEHRVRQKVATHCLTNEVLVVLYRAFFIFFRNLNSLPTFKNREVSHKNPDSQLLLKN